MFAELIEVLEDVSHSRWVYLAGQYDSHAYLESIAERLRAEGYVVTSSWHRPLVVRKAAADRAAGIPSLPVSLAAGDMNDIDKADALVLFDAGASTGKFVELGYALAKSMPVIVIQATTRRNVFAACADWTIDVSGDDAERHARLDAILAAQSAGYVEA